MFGERFAFGYQGAGDESGTPPWARHRGHHPHFGRHAGPSGEQWEGGWTPPWFQHEDMRGRGPRFFAMRRGRGPFGPGGPFGQGGPHFGHGGPFGPGGEGGRFFGRGDMKFALLQLLQEHPMHGYEMMKALEEKSGGFYTPSPGSIYPTLQMLEDRGFVTSNEVEGKRVYSITDAGRSLLTERQGDAEDFAGPPWMRGRGPGGHGPRPEMRALRSEAGEVARLFAIAGRMSLQNPEQLARLRSIIERTRKELTDLIYGTGSQQGQPTTTGESSSESPTIDQA
jgi:DNA-binding PadR family transcriptional regulator